MKNFKKLLDTVINQITDVNRKSIFATSVIDKFLDIKSVRDFNKEKRLVQHSVNIDDLNALLEYIDNKRYENEPAFNLYNAFGDCCLYNTSMEKASKDLDADLEDLDFLKMVCLESDGLFKKQDVPLVVSLRENQP